MSSYALTSVSSRVFTTRCRQREAALAGPLACYIPSCTCILSRAEPAPINMTCQGPNLSYFHLPRHHHPLAGPCRAGASAWIAVAGAAAPALPPPWAARHTRPASVHQHVERGAQVLAPRLRQVRQHGADEVDRHDRARVVRRLLRARRLRRAVHLRVRSSASQAGTCLTLRVFLP